MTSEITGHLTHNLKVVGSNPTPATKFERGPHVWGPLLSFAEDVDLNLARGPASGMAA
jgi:hypothetical protein